VTGQRPWDKFNQSQVIHAITTGKTLTLPHSMPACVRKFVAKCLAPRPDDRPAFADMIAELEELEDELVGVVAPMGEQGIR
jgi:hypothetical protein